MEEQIILKYQARVICDIEKDARENALTKASHYCKGWHNKTFRMSRKEFTQEVEDSILLGEYSSAERFLRYIEADDKILDKTSVCEKIKLFTNSLCVILKEKYIILPEDIICHKENTEIDAVRLAEAKAKYLCGLRGGKFKISEKAVIEEMEIGWVVGETLAVRRILSSIGNDDFESKDMIRGEIHMMIMDLHKILKRRSLLSFNLKLEDLIWGSMSTKKSLENFRSNT